MNTPRSTYTESQLLNVQEQSVAQAFRDLGVTQQEFETIRRAPFQQAQQLLADLKERVKKRVRKIALELHPDVTGNDPVKTGRFKAALEMRDRIEQLVVQAPPPVRPLVAFWHPFVILNVRVVHQNHGPVNGVAAEPRNEPGSPKAV